MRWMTTIALALSLAACGGADEGGDTTENPADTTGAETAAAFMRRENPSGRAVLLSSASSPAARQVELHDHIHDEGVMRMRKVDSIEIPAHGSTELRAGSMHVMLIGLVRPLEAGDQVRLTLGFGGQQTEILVPVVDRSGPASQPSTAPSSKPHD